MKSFASNNDGVALVTSLVLTLVSLTIVMAVMYMVTQSVQTVGLYKRYKTALEASYGGTDVVMKDIIPYVLKNYASGTLLTDAVTAYSMINLDVQATQVCLQNKLTKATTDWTAACNSGLSAKTASDFVFRLQSTGGAPYAVYSKIVDTVVGNTDMSGLQLEGAGVAETLSVITPQHIPFVYRMEIQTERAQNAYEQSNISVLYAY